jgi:hypothetical protein
MIIGMPHVLAAGETFAALQAEVTDLLTVD